MALTRGIRNQSWKNTVPSCSFFWSSIFHLIQIGDDLQPTGMQYHQELPQDPLSPSSWGTAVTQPTNALMMN